MLDAFPDIAPTSETHVLVREGEVTSPFTNEEKVFNFGSFAYNERLCYYSHPDDASKFIIHNLKDYTEVIFNFDSEDMRQTVLSYFYGTGLSSILHYNESLPIHASGVTLGEELYLFCGRSGIGKSTLATGLKLRGYDLFSDDKCVLSNRDGIWSALPGLTIMRLWQNTIDTMDPSDFLHDAKAVIFRKDKYQYQIDEDHLDLTPKKVKAIYIIRNVAVEESLSVEELSGRTKLAQFQQQIFRRKMIKGMGMEQHLWQFLIKVLQDIPVFIIYRPLETNITAFSDYVHDQISTHHK